MNFLKKKWVRILLQAGGLLLFVVILTRVDIPTVLGLFRRITLPHVALIVGLLVLLTLVKGLRWRRIVAAQGRTVSVGRAFTVYAASLYLGVVTPGRVGDFAKSLYLANAGMSMGKSLFSSFLDRFFDLLFLVLIGYVSLLLFPSIFRNQLLLSSLLLLVAAVAVLALFWRRDLLRGAARRFLSAVTPERIGQRLETVITETLGEFDLLGSRFFFAILLLTIVAWFIHYTVFVLLADVLGIDTSVHFIVVCVSAAVFTALLPVSLSGLGTRDLVLILIFGRVGLSKEAAVSFSLTFILVYIVQGCIGLVCWLADPIYRGDGEAFAVEEEK